MFAMAQGVYRPPQSGINVGRVVVRALSKIEWSLKHAALEMEWDEATFSKAIHGLAPLDAHRLAMLPARFWWKFFRLMLAAILRRDDLASESSQRRSA